MKRLGVYVDVKHFKKLESETSKMLLQLEDKIIAHITPYLTNFTLGKSVEEAVSTQRLIKKIAEIEGVQLPINEKTQKETLAKADVKKEYQKNPHWLWAYILGESEIPYSDNKLNLIKQELFLEIEERRYAFNINSPRHLAWLFCEKLGVDAELLPQTASATKDNIIPSMEAEVLETSMLPKFEWVKDLLVYKKLAKAYSTYIAPALRLNIEGWVFVDWKQNGTVSGRFSCKGWNLQTLPKVEEEICPQCGNTDMEITPLIELLGSKKCTKCGYQEDNIILPSAIKKGFVAPKGMKFVNADYSSLEPRIFAFMSAEEKLKDVFRKGYDLYSQVYCDVVDFRKQYSANPEDENYLKKKNPAERVRIKPIVLGIVYGEKDGQVARLMGMVEKDGTPIYESGKLIRDSYLRAYPGLNQYMHKCEADCINKGYVETLIGRKRHFEFAPYVAKLILGKYFKDTKETHSLKKKLFDEFINTSNSKLNSPDVKIGNAIILTEEGLKELAKTFKIDYAKIVKKGYWGLIKNLAKQEYNNAKNIPIQGLASHVTNKASIEIARLLKKHNIEGYVCLQIHDEITLLVAEGQAEEAGKLLKQAMECNQYAKRLDVPMIAEPIICDNLKESK
jgi:DNA polymerase I-like protein with 3'-5' exonuclease and polymerase domains